MLHTQICTKEKLDNIKLKLIQQKITRITFLIEFIELSQKFNFKHDNIIMNLFNDFFLILKHLCFSLVHN